MDRTNRAESVPHFVSFRNNPLLVFRRSFLAASLALPLCPVLSLIGPAFAQQAAPPAATAPPAQTQPTPATPAGPPVVAQVDIKTTNLGRNLYMLEGQGGNITVAAGQRLILVVDSQFANQYDKIRAAIRPLSKSPVRYLVNTHLHGDHTGGNASFAKDGVTVVAQENVKKRLAAGTTNGLTGNKTAPATGGALPSRTYVRALNLRLGGMVAHLNNIPNAHTDGDTYVWFKLGNVIATGDTFTNGRYPNIDFANGGNIRGMIAAADRYIGLANDQTKIVPGHGPLASKADLVAYRNMLIAARDRVAALIKQGKSEADVIAARPMKDFDAKQAATDQAAVNFLRVVYNSLKPPQPGASPSKSS